MPFLDLNVVHEEIGRSRTYVRCVATFCQLIIPSSGYSLMFCMHAPDDGLLC
jgi:hypothetical protein